MGRTPTDEVVRGGMRRWNTLSSEDLYRRLEEIDRDISREGVPVHSRAFEAFSRIVKEGGVSSGVLIGPDGPSPLFAEMNAWYKQRYGERILLDLKIGEKPFVLRGLVYFLRFPLAYGTVELRPLNFVVGLTEDMAHSLTEQEHLYIAERFSTGFYEFLSLANLRSAPLSLKPQAKEMTERALFDLNAAVSLLKSEEDTHGSVFHAQQGAEKFMKAALLQYGSEPERRHDLKATLDALVAHHKKFQYLSPAIGSVNFPMDIRYADKGLTQERAVEAIDAALHICCFVSDQWQLDKDRKGIDTVWVPGKFYRNSLGLNYRCIEIEKAANGSDVARVALLDNHGVDAVLRQKCEFGFLYVEITNSEEINRLEQRYRTVILGQRGV